MGAKTMDEPIRAETQSLDRIILQEETREELEEIRKKARKQERRGLKTFAKYVGGTILAGALLIGEVVGIHYAANERVYTQHNGTQVESRVDGLLEHTRLEHATDGSRTIGVYTPFETITARSYTDRDGDGQVDDVWSSRGFSDPWRGSIANFYSRGDSVFNADYIDSTFQDGLERFGEPIIVEPRLP